MSSMFRVVLYAAYQTVQPPSLVASQISERVRERVPGIGIAFLDTKPHERRAVRGLMY
jgi:hypothetical protein